MEISKNVWRTGTRPCSFSLCLQESSVFADFNIDPDGRVFAVRISFDGYGCRPTKGKATTMALEDSQVLLRHFEMDDLNRDEVRRILYQYFEQNGDVIGRGALADHELINRSMGE